MTLGLGALTAVEYDAITSLQDRGQMDPRLVTLGFATLFIALVLAAAFGIWRLVRSQAYHMMDE